jgi:hypothetical protein
MDLRLRSRRPQRRRGRQHSSLCDPRSNFASIGGGDAAAGQAPGPCARLAASFARAFVKVSSALLELAASSLASPSF